MPSNPWTDRPLNTSFVILRVMIPHIKDDGTLQHVGFILDQWQRIHDGKHKEMKAWLESKE